MFLQVQTPAPDNKQLKRLNSANKFLITEPKTYTEI